MKSILFTLALSSLPIFLAPSRSIATDVADWSGDVEQIYGMTADAEGITFQVFSGGCTNKEDFRVERFTSYPDGSPTQLLLVRLRHDLCRANLPYGTTINFSYDDLHLTNGDRFVVLNPRSEMTVFMWP